MENIKLIKATILFIEAACQSYKLVDDPCSVSTSNVRKQLKNIRCKFDSSEPLTEGSIPSIFESQSRELNSLHEEILALHANVNILHGHDELRRAANKRTALVNYRLELVTKVSIHVLRVIEHCSSCIDSQIKAAQYNRRNYIIP